VEGAITYPTEFVKTRAQFSTTNGQSVCPERHCAGCLD
jgi:hypothetical protein